MAISIKALGDGQLAAAKATLYTAPGGTQTILRSVTLVNTDSSARTVNIYVNRTGASRRIIPKDLSLAAGEAHQYQTIVTLEAADIIEGDASVASVVDYTLNGVENA